MEKKIHKLLTNEALTGKSNFMKYAAFCIFLPAIFLFGCSSPKNLTAEKPFYFIQMADPQFGMITENKGFKAESVNFQKAIEGANHLHPTFVIVCGDLVNQTNNPSQIAEYKRIAGEIDPSIPVYTVAGNHDVGNRPTAKSLSDYRKKFGPDYYSFRAGNILGIVLNSSLFSDPSLVAAEATKQDKWLLSTLKRAKKDQYNIVIFQHIPWFLNQPNEKDGYFNIPLSRRLKYLDLFHEYGVKYIFAGHFHKNSRGNYRGIEMITSGPVGKPLGKDPSGFRVVRVNKDKMEDSYYGLDSIPQSLQNVN